MSYNEVRRTHTGLVVLGMEGGMKCDPHWWQNQNVLGLCSQQLNEEEELLTDLGRSKNREYQ